MSNAKYKIPKQTDVNILTALGKIRSQVRGAENWLICVTPCPSGAPIHIPSEIKEPQHFSALQYLIEYNSQIAEYFSLRTPDQNNTILEIHRDHESITDYYVITDAWLNKNQNNQNLIVALIAAARSELKVSQVEANLSGFLDKEWGRYLESQQTILHSLQSTAQTILIDSQRRNMELDRLRQDKFDKMEEEYKSKYKTVEEKHNTDYAKKLDDLNSRESALQKEKAEFNTLEARYVARNEQKEQIKKIQDWLEGWNITKGTTTKRTPIHVAYVIGLLLTGIIAVWFSYQNIEILKTKELEKLAWWHWALLTLKSLVPFLAFTTFLIYYIRWTSAWASQHTEEEFRNRNRLMDIGRSAWLLEAVRDAHDHGKQLPADLIRELSRNLFFGSTFRSTDELQPQTSCDMLLQGLSSLRIKTPDGSEMEATKIKKEK
jgi:hypothetical protein